MIPEWYLNGNAREEYKSFVDDLIGFLKESSKKHEKPTLVDKHDYLFNTLKVDDFIRKHKFFNNYKILNSDFLTYHDISDLFELVSFNYIMDNKVDPEKVNDEDIPSITFGNYIDRGINIKINTAKAYRMGLIEIPFIGYSFDFDKIEEAFQRLAIPYSAIKVKHQFPILISNMIFLQESGICNLLKQIDDRLIDMSKYYEKTHTILKDDLFYVQEIINEINNKITDYYLDIDKTIRVIVKDIDEYNKDHTVDNICKQFANIILKIILADSLTIKNLPVRITFEYDIRQFIFGPSWKTIDFVVSN